ncbi:MAG: nucleotidyltransferase domain-containing protein [Spirochaeta sp.]|nr:nucleotidyltransferase domain-containing protein [Spirochaeta sp.]
MSSVQDEVIRECATVLKACLPHLEFACLYGSCARGEMLPFSDIDIGLYLPEDPDILSLGDVAGRLETALRRPVDILLLRGLPERDPELAFRVADEGVLITEDRRHRYAQFKKQAFLYYLDTEYLRKLTRSALHRRVLSGNMGRRNYV